MYYELKKSAINTNVKELNWLSNLIVIVRYKPKINFANKESSIFVLLILLLNIQFIMSLVILAAIVSI